MTKRMSDTRTRALAADFSRRAVLKASAAGAAAFAFGAPAIVRAAEPVRIGILGPLSNFTGIDLARTATMAAEEINAGGGILGRTLEIVNADSEGVPEKAIQAFQQLAAREQVDAIVGGFRSGAVLALLPYIARFKTPFLVTGAASPDITQPVADSYDTHKYIFRPWVNATTQAENLALVCRDILKAGQGITKVAIDAENYKWARDYAGVLQERLPEYGIEIVADISHDPATKDFTPVFRQARNAGAEALLPIISNEAGYIIVKQYRDQQVPLVLCGNNNASYLTSSFWGETDGAAEYELSAVVKAPITEKTIPFWDAFEARYDDSPFYTSLCTYDSFFMLKQAMEGADSTDRDAIVPRLEDIAYTGAAGVIRFDERHEVISTPEDMPFPYGQWQDGEKVAIWPERFATGSFQRPPWMS